VNATDWPTIRETFVRIAIREGITKVAGEVPAHPSTIYRMIRGDTRRAHLAKQAGIERIVQERQERKP
jgi:hypothetical protein